MITINDETIVTLDDEGNEEKFQLGSKEGFKLLSELWLRSGWDTKYVYSFSWLGRPIIQLPEDMIRIQELIYGLKPDVVIETGVAHGGSLVFYASLFKSMGKGRVIGIDIDIREHNKVAIENHELSELIHLIEGSSIESSTVERVKMQIKSNENVLVILDSNHSYKHVLDELRLYGSMVSSGSYIVACDGIMQEVVGAPRTEPDWDKNNPQVAVNQFLKENKNFVLEEPKFPFNEGEIKDRVTYWPNAHLRRI